MDEEEHSLPSPIPIGISKDQIKLISDFYRIDFNPKDFNLGKNLISDYNACFVCVEIAKRDFKLFSNSPNIETPTRYFKDYTLVYLHPQKSQALTL
jgi:hypothetical protein